MLKFTKLSDLLDSTSTGLKAIILAITLIGVLAAAVPLGKAFLGMPGQLDEHAKSTAMLIKIEERSLCITVADHRKLDWSLCYINPQAVMPPDSAY